jgi:alkylation response protein AidB-like acyl-CoA dehydrogenase
MILNEERGYQHAPFNGPAPGTIGPPLILNGTPEQKAQHLPGLASAEVQWCQGFSEPNAGSDLASLQTRAVEDGDNYVVNGSKIWTSFAHYADWCYLGVRTDTEAPKHRGISVLLVDMKTPGISIRPIPNMGGYHSFNQVFFDNVVVSKENLLGEKNRGWYLMAQTLDFERSNIEGNARTRRTIEELVQLANNTLDPFGRPVAADPLVWRKLTEVAIQAEAQKMICYRVVSMQARGLVPNKEASIDKLFASELSQKVASVALDVLGQTSQLSEADQTTAFSASLVRHWLINFPSTIAAGSSEIQRNIIAQRGLGMPRG